MTDDETDLVRNELAVAALLIASGVLLAGVTEAALDLWQVGVAVAAATAVLSAAADRSRTATWAAVGVAGLAVLAFLWSAWTGLVPVGVVPPFNAGVGVGVAVNRVAFGVLGPLPEARVERASDR